MYTLLTAEYAIDFWRKYQQFMRARQEIL